METHGIIIIDASLGRITVMHCTHNRNPSHSQDPKGENDIQIALQRYRDKYSNHDFDWMEFKEPLTIHSL